MSISTSYVDRRRMTALVVDNVEEGAFNGPGLALGALVTNSGAADRWFMGFDANAQPANGTSPIVCVRIATLDQVNIPMALACATDFTWAVSSTGGTLTHDVATDFGVQLFWEE